jgi:pimeloyl-ACP methyl ester carboxylesterase
MRTARNGDVTIAYETFGSPAGTPLLLIAGTGVQMLIWPEEFCAALAGRGFHVARFDNRDMGLSTHLTGTAAPGWVKVMLRPSSAPYRLDDMAGDALAVIDAQGWQSAHVVGASLGGMVAQSLAIRHPARVRTLTSIMSTPSSRIATMPKMAVMRALAEAAGTPVTSEQEAADQAARRGHRIRQPPQETEQPAHPGPGHPRDRRSGDPPKGRPGHRAGHSRRQARDLSRHGPRPPPRPVAGHDRRNQHPGMSPPAIGHPTTRVHGVSKPVTPPRSLAMFTRYSLILTECHPLPWRSAWPPRGRPLNGDPSPRPAPMTNGMARPERNPSKLVSFSDGVFTISGIVLGALVPVAGVVVIALFMPTYYLPIRGEYGSPQQRT